MLLLFKYLYIILKFIQYTSAQNTQQLYTSPNTNTYGNMIKLKIKYYVKKNNFNISVCAYYYYRIRVLLR
jgi:hypothetical protein